MPSLFRRKPADVVEESVVDEPTPEPAEPSPRQRGYTPSKKDLGKETPKRASAQRRRVAEPPPANRREAYRRMRAKQREERSERMAAMRAGDERYLLPRDRGPERALVRDIVDSRRTVGTYYFVGALLALVGSSGAMPPVVRATFNLLFPLLTLTVIVDSVLISRRIKQLVRERFPKTTVRMGSLYLYAIMRSITFRKMRMPKPRVKIGEKI